MWKRFEGRGKVHRALRPIKPACKRSLLTAPEEAGVVEGGAEAREAGKVPARPQLWTEDFPVLSPPDLLLKSPYRRQWGPVLGEGPERRALGWSRR